MHQNSDFFEELIFQIPPTLWRRMFFVEKAASFFCLIVGTKVKGFLLGYSVAYSARDGRCLEKQRVSDAAVTIFDV